MAITGCALVSFAAVFASLAASGCAQNTCCLSSTGCTPLCPDGLENQGSGMVGRCGNESISGECPSLPIEATRSCELSECFRCQSLHEPVDSPRFCRNRTNRFASSDNETVLEMEQHIAFLHTIVEDTIGSTNNCSDFIRDFMCDYVFPPCTADNLPMPPCLEYCRSILNEECTAEYMRIMVLIDASASILPNDDPLSTLRTILPNNSCNTSSVMFYVGQNYSDVCTDQSVFRSEEGEEGEEGEDYNLQTTLILVCVAGAVIIVVLLVALCCVVVCCRIQRRRDEPKGAAYSYSFPGVGRTATLLGWPFVHPRSSRFKSKGVLFKQVPEAFMDTLGDYQDYLIQASKVHTSVFLAEGTYSEIYQGYIADLQPDGASTYRNVAVKRFKEHVKTPDIVEFLEACLKVCSAVHPNVLRIIGMSFDSSGSISVVYPYMEKHDLLTYLKKKRAHVFSGNTPQDFSAGQLVEAVMHISLGMKAIAEKGIPYKMLSAHNCLIDTGNRIVVGDVCMYLQLALRGAVSEEIYHRWMAPEGIRENRFTEKSDVWSFGVTCWEVFTLGSTPYSELEHRHVLAHVTAGKRLPRPPLCPHSLFAVMEKCWQREPRERPFFSTIVDEVNTIMCTATYKEEIARVDKALRRGEIEPMGGSPSSHPVSTEKKAVEEELTASGYARVQISSEEGDQIPLVVIKRKGKSPPRGASHTAIPSYLQLIADDKETAEEYVEVTPDTTAEDYVDVTHNSADEEYVEVTHNSAAEEYVDTRQFSERAVHEIVNFEDDENFYENPDITRAPKRHSVGDLRSNSREDEYYNIPQSFLSAMPKSKSKSTEAIHDSKSTQLPKREVHNQSSTPAKVKPAVPKKPDISHKTANKAATLGANLDLSPTT